MALTKISGSILKDPLNLGEVSIGGTLTYQDVTNVDSVGIGTFRDGINVSGGQLDVGSNIKLGNAGVITATSATFTSGNVKLASDSQRLQLGSAQDLWMYHTGTSGGGHGLIQNEYGTMYMLSANWEYRHFGTNNTTFKINGNQSVQLFYNNSSKLATTNAGVTVSGLSVQTDADISGDFSIADKIVHTGDTNTAIRFPAADTITAETAGSERLRITSTGKVNIGDTQMSQNIFNIEDGTAAALDIASHGSGGDTAYIGVKKSDGGGLTIGISNRDIIFKTGATYSSGTVFDSGNEKVRITSAGSMGVGTNTPDRKLDVSGTGNVYGKFQSTNTTGAGIEVKDISEDWLIQADGGALDGLAFYDLGRTSYRFIMGNAGQFGVGSGSGRYGLTRQALVSGGGSAAPSWSSNPLLLDMDGLGDIDYDGVFLRYRETATVSGNGLIYLGLCKSTTNCPAGRIGVPVGFIPSTAFNGHFRVDKVGITPWPDSSGHRYEYYAIISDYVSSGKLGVFYLTNSTN